MKTLGCGRQRESIRISLMNQYDHLTADVLYVSIREEFPNISLETIYRNLSLLIETGEIKKLTYRDGANHFDGDIRQHYRLVCMECNQAYDMDLGALKELNQEAQKNAPGIINNHYVLFYGRCRKCLGKRVDKGIGKPA